MEGNESVTTAESAENSNAELSNQASLIGASSENEVSQEESAWNLTESIKGEGEIPDWFIADKYKNVEEQAKATKAFEKRLGGFTGAPDEYEIAIAEDLQGKVDIDMESDEFKAFESLARESNMSNEVFNSLVNQYLGNFNKGQEPSEEDIASYKKAEMEKLGDNGVNVVNEVTSWAKNNLNESEFNQFRGLADSADNIMLLQKLITKNNPTKVEANINSAPSYTRDQLREMLGSEKYLEGDREYQRHVDGLYKAAMENGTI